MKLNVPGAMIVARRSREALVRRKKCHKIFISEGKNRRKINVLSKKSQPPKKVALSII